MTIDKRVILKITYLFIVERFGLLIWMYFIRIILPISIDQSNLRLMHVPIEVNPWLEPWQRWDTIHYQAISIYGYKAFDSALFAPPLYPFLIHLLTPLTSNNSLIAAILISNIAFLFSLYILYIIAFLKYRNEKQALKIIYILLLFPLSFFFFAAYTESLFFLFFLITIYFLQHKKWVYASIFSGLSTLTRVTGIVVFGLLIALLIIEIYHTKDIKPIFSIAIGGMIALIFPLYVYFVMKMPIISIFQAIARGGRIALPGLNVIVAIKKIIQGNMLFENILEISSLILLIYLIMAGWKNYSLLYRLLSALFLLFYLTRLGNPQPLIGMARYIIVVVPIYFTLGDMIENQNIKKPLLFIALFLQLFLSGQFAIGGWVG